MADQNQELDRSESATPFKLQKARERGQVAKSADLVSVLVFTVAMVFLNWKGWDAWRDLFRLDRSLLVQAAALGPGAGELWALVAGTVKAALSLAVPFLLALMLAAVAGNLVQTGPVLSFEPVKADWSRINPATGFKRFFNRQMLFNSVRSCIKLLLLAWVAYTALKSLVPTFYELSVLAPGELLRRILAGVAALGLRIAAALWVIAAVDLVHSRLTFAKQMRMSRRELRDEVKHREGDPRIRARQRQLRQELLKRAIAARKTSKADVVITNPTHFAVALKYVHGEMVAPQLVAKGAGRLAALMREIAGRHRIPVVQNPSLARQLFHRLPVDGSVPPELYARVARIIVWVLAMREATAQRSSPALASREAPWGA